MLAKNETTVIGPTVNAHACEYYLLCCVMVDFDGIFLCSVLRRLCNNCWTYRLLLTNITFTYVCFSPASQMVQGVVNGRVVSTVATDRLPCAQRKLRKTEGASTGFRQYPVSPCETPDEGLQGSSSQSTSCPGDRHGFRPNCVECGWQSYAHCQGCAFHWGQAVWRKT